MTEREAFLVELAHQPLVGGDVIVLLQGDGNNRVAYAAELYAHGQASSVVLVGGDTRTQYGSYPGSGLREQLLVAGVPAEAIIFEETAQHTRAEAVRVIELAKERGWKSLLIVTSPHHMYRAFLTFLKAMQDAGLELILQPAPVRDLPWHANERWGMRIEVFGPELERIETYGLQGDVASYAVGLTYLRNKESKS